MGLTETHVEQDHTLARKVETVKPILWLSKGELKRWARRVDLEAEAEPGRTHAAILRDHSSVLDQKTAALVAFIGFMAAAMALIAPQLVADASSRELTSRVTFFVVMAIATFASGAYGLSALGLMVSRIPKEATPDALLIANLQRVAYRAFNFNLALRSAQVAAAFLSLLVGMMVGEAV
jgi:hypothetical protein